MLPEINSVAAERSFEVKSGALRVTDPCYTMDVWCAGTLYKVKNGKWFAHVGYYRDASEIEWAKEAKRLRLKEIEVEIKIAMLAGADRELAERMFAHRRRNVEALDPEACVGRVAYLAIRHESRPFCPPSSLSFFTESEIDVGVDSGQAGFFDLAPYRAQAETAREDGERVPGSEHEKFYRQVCNLTLDEVEAAQFGALEFGAVSCSGYGDGGYTLYELRDSAGEVVEAIIVFIDDTEEAEEE